MIKKIALGGLIASALCSVLLVTQIKVATYMYDSKMGSILTKVERKVPGLKLSYESTSSSFTARKGRIHYSIKLKPGNALKADKLSGAIDVGFSFGPLRVDGEFASVPKVGNIEQILSSFNVEPISFEGMFEARALTPLLNASVKTSSFLLPNTTGLCKVGENMIHAQATSTDDVTIEIASSGMMCEGAMRYAEHPNYRLDLSGLSIEFLPRILNQKPHFDSFELNVDQLDFRFSTIYALGFSPEDKVKDPTLQEAVSFSNIKTKVALTTPDEQGMSRVSLSNTGNYGFAFPYIENNEVQPFYRFDNFHFNGSLDSVSIPALYEASKEITASAGDQFSTKQMLSEILKGFSEDITFVLKSFGYEHKAETVEINGESTLSFDLSGRKPKVDKLNADFRIKAGKELVEEMASEQYQKILEMAVAGGQITLNGNRYETRFTMKDKETLLNGQPLYNLDGDDDDEELYAEEQRMLQLEQEQRRREAAALKAEIEAAKEAQRNLPSMREGNLSEQN